MEPDFKNRRLQHADHAIRPLGMGLSSAVSGVDWYGRGATDLLVTVDPWCLSAGVYLFLQDLDAGQNEEPPRYLPPRRLDQLTGHYFAPVQLADPAFDLVSFAPRNPGPRSQQTSRSIGWMRRYRNHGGAGAPMFHQFPDEVSCAGAALEAALGSARLMSIAPEYDAGGHLCAAVISVNSDPMAYWPDRRLPWQAEDSPFRGRDAAGAWRGEPAAMRVLRFPFGKDRQRPVFGAPTLIWETQSLFSADAAIWRSGDGQRHIAIRSDTDLLTIRPLHAAQGRSLRMENNFFKTSICGLPPRGGKGDSLLVSGNTGYVSRIADPLRDPREELLMSRGGAVRVGTLAVPTFSSRQGRRRLCVGDAAGRLHAFDELPGGVFGPGRRLRGPFGILRHMAGETGSIQGPNERSWGYTNPLLTPWLVDGVDDLIVGDITGGLTLYHPLPGNEGLSMEAPRPLRLAGQPLRMAWRSRPARWSANELLVHMDTGLCLLRRDPAAPLDLHPGRPVHFPDGAAIAARAPGGLAGRSVLEKIFWDSGSVGDLLVAVDGRTVPDFGGPACTGAAVLLLRGVADGAALVLRPAGLLCTRAGEPLMFGMHNPGVTVIPGREEGASPQIVVGAEDGHLYAWSRDDLIVRPV